MTSLSGAAKNLRGTTLRRQALKVTNRRRLALLLACALTAPSALADAPPSARKANLAREPGLLDQDWVPDRLNNHKFWFKWRSPVTFGLGLDQRNGFAQARTPFAGGSAGLAAEPQGLQLNGLIPTVGLFRPWDPVRAQIGAVDASIGHGTIVNSFTTAPLGGARSPGLYVSGALAGLGGELLLANALSPTTMIAGRVHARPLMLAFAPSSALLRLDDTGFEPGAELLGALVVGAQFATDMQRGASAFGVDGELALVDTEALNLGLYVDLNTLATPGSVGSGAHVGSKIGVRLNDLVSLDTELELYAGSDGYLARYFDRLYMVERDQVLGHTFAKAEAPLAGAAGFRGRASARFDGLTTLHLEVNDRLSGVRRDGRMSAGVHTMIPFAVTSLGLGLTLSQTDVEAMTRGAVFAPGFVALGEARMAALLDVAHVVVQTWTVHREVTPAVSAWEVGAQVGLELRFGAL